MGEFDSALRGSVTYQQLKTVLTKIRRDADMLLVRIMIYLAVVSAIIIFFMGASGGDEP